MPWFKIDDTFAMHEKVMAAGNPAIGLWARAGAWSMQQLTDGFVPDHVLRVLGTPKERRNLVEVSLWDEVKGGVQFRNWEERQPTKDQVEAARQAAADRQRHARERAKSQRESRCDTGVSHGPPDPTRPDPTPKSSVGGDGLEEPAAAPPAKSRKKPAKPLPADWRPTADHHTRCIDSGLDPATELAKFRAHAEANDRRQVNWNAAFTQWLLTARPGSVRPIRPTTDEQGRTVLPPLPKGIFE